MPNKINNLLKLEENEQLYKHTYTYKNIMMYPVIRSYLFEEATKELYGFKYEDAIINSFFVKFKYLFKAFFILLIL